MRCGTVREAGPYAQFSRLNENTIHYPLAERWSQRSLHRIEVDAPYIYVYGVQRPAAPQGSIKPVDFTGRPNSPTWV